MMILKNGDIVSGNELQNQIESQQCNCSNEEEDRDDYNILDEKFDIPSSTSQNIIQLLWRYYCKNDYKNAIDVSLLNGLLMIPKCKTCSSLMKLYKENGYCLQHTWHCSACNDRQKLYSNHPIWENYSIPITKVLILFFIYLPQQINRVHISEMLDIGQNTITKMRQSYQKLFKYHRKLRSTGRAVEIDESSFRRKYNHGRILQNSQSVFGLTERGGGFTNTFIFIVPDRSASTLLPIISKYVSKDTPLICSDKWKAYSQLSKLNKTHETVNRSLEFVRSKKQRKKTNQKRRKKYYDLVNNFSIHTQSIENRWKHLKKRLKKSRKGNFIENICESHFYLMYRNDLIKKTIDVCKLVLPFLKQ